MEVLKTLGVFGIVMGGIIWISKLFFEKYFSLQSKKLEQKHQIIFSKLHEERASIIAELYSKIMNVEDSLNSFTYTIFNEEHKLSIKNEVAEDFRNLRNFFERKKIYFSLELCEMFSRLFHKQTKIWVDIQRNDLVSEDEKGELFNKTKEDINIDLNIVKEQIENEFRKLLGVN